MRVYGGRDVCFECLDLAIAHVAGPLKSEQTKAEQDVAAKRRRIQEEE